MDDVASSQAHRYVCEGRMHCVIVVPEVARSLDIIISIDLYVTCLVRSYHKFSWDVFIEERVVLLITKRLESHSEFGLVLVDAVDPRQRITIESWPNL